ncbi:MAG: hypothetical protein KC422_24900 [Trueperaceae bacterium]|nr:hypothetical protein [Trueperaceae bacterium]
MKYFKTYLLVIGASLILIGFAQESPYVLTTYDLSQLSARPGKIFISPDVLTLLEFDDQVSDVSTARPDAMTIEVSGNIIRLRANWRAGSTDLVVTIANQTALFSIDIEPEGDYSRRYLITEPKPSLPSTSSSSSPARSKASEAIDQATQVPDWLSVSFTVLSSPGEEILIQYGIKNLGKHDVITDAQRLRLMQAGYQTPYKLERISTGGTTNRIKPGFAEYGMILISDPLPEKLSLLWDIVEIGPGTTYTLKKDFHEGLLEPVR